MIYFVGIILIATSLIGLINGTLFKNKALRVKEIAADYRDNYYYRSEEVYVKDMMTEMLLPLLVKLAIFIAKLAFLINMIYIPSLTFPTIFMMVLVIVSIIKLYNSKKTVDKKKIKTPEEKAVSEKEIANRIAKKKIRTLYRTTIDVVSLVYYIYAMAVLLGFAPFVN